METLRSVLVQFLIVYGAIAATRDLPPAIAYVFGDARRAFIVGCYVSALISLNQIYQSLHIRLTGTGSILASCGLYVCALYAIVKIMAIFEGYKEKESR